MTTFADLQQQLAQLQPVKGITAVDILNLPDSVAALIRKIMRGSMAVSVLAGELGLPLEQARQVGDAMVEKGYLTSEGAESESVIYKVNFAHMRRHNIALDL